MIKDNTVKKLRVTSEPSFKRHNIWSFKKMGFSQEQIGSGNKSLNFKPLKQDWLIDLAKDYFIYKSKRVKPSRLNGILMSLKKYDRFLVSIYYDKYLLKDFIKPENIMDFIVSLNQNSNNTISVVFSGMRDFFEYLEKIDVIPSFNKLIPLDLKPRMVLKPNPRPIDSKSVSHIKECCKAFDTFLKRLLFINFEVGARVNEILLLKEDCISKSELGWVLTRYESKSNRYITTPISDQCADVVKIQILEANNARKQFIYNYNHGIHSDDADYIDNSPYIFIHIFQKRLMRYGIRTVNYAIKKFISLNNIKDEDGNLLKISSHNSRHTVASNLVENGVNQIYVQRFLGHKTPGMTNFYAKISENKMRIALKFDEVSDSKLNDIYGNVYSDVKFDIDNNLDHEWLRKNISAHILPNGICSLPIRQTCHHGNACLSCVSFRTGPVFKEKLEDQKDRLIKIISIAHEGGLTEQADLNNKTLSTLNVILDKIDEKN